MTLFRAFLTSYFLSRPLRKHVTCLQNLLAKPLPLADDHSIAEVRIGVKQFRTLPPFFPPWQEGCSASLRAQPFCISSTVSFPSPAPPTFWYALFTLRFPHLRAAFGGMSAPKCMRTCKRRGFAGGGEGATGTGGERGLRICYHALACSNLPIVCSPRILNSFLSPISLPAEHAGPVDHPPLFALGSA